MEEIRKISVVIPVYNEEENVPILYKQLKEVLDSLSYDYEIIFVNDGSTDRTGEVLEESEKKVALIVSADHGHAHDENGPYGYRKESEEYDRLVMKLINENRLEELPSIPDELIEKALPDSYWQMLIMLGVMHKVQVKLVESAYACPTYFGMAGALWMRR